MFQTSHSFITAILIDVGLEEFCRDVNCSSLVCWQMSNSRLFHTVLHWRGQCLTTTSTTTCCTTFWASIGPMYADYVSIGPMLKTVPCNCRQCPTLKPVSWKPYNYLWSSSSTANTSWRGAHSLPFKPLSDIFETFWISASICVRNVQNSTNMPYKDLTCYKIFLAVKKYKLWDGAFCPKTRLAGLQMVFIQSKPVWEETIRESLASGGKVGGLPWNDSMFKYWLWYPSPPLLPLCRHINIQNFEKKHQIHTPSKCAPHTLHVLCI